MNGLPAEVRDRLPAHRRSVGTEPQSGLPEFWIIGKCGGCGAEWARQGEGNTWDAVCGCGGQIRPRRGDFPTGKEAVPDSEQAWAKSEALVAFRMPETVAVSITGNWSGERRRYREFTAHIDAGWPIYDTPPCDESFAQWAMQTFRFGPKVRPIRLAVDVLDEYAALEGVQRIDKDGETILRCPFGDLFIVDCDPALAAEDHKAPA